MPPSFTRRAAFAAGAALPLAATRPSRAQAPAIKLGVLSDMSGPYSDNTGQGSVVAARMAIEDFTRTRPGLRVDLISADNQNRADVGMSIARSWYDREGVDCILDVPLSALALAMGEVVREKNKVALYTGPAASDLTGRACGPNHIHWTYDTWALAHGTGTALVAEGGDTWFFLTADYAFGHALERDTGGFVTAAGGRVLGQARYPFPGTTDFSSFLLQAQASRAKVLGLANAGSDTINCIKQAAEFGLTRRGMRLAGLLLQIPDVHGVGLQAAQGLVMTDSFYWDLDDGTRAFTERFHPQNRGIRPTQIHAGTYSAVLHYLKAVESMGVAAAKADGAAVVRRMKEMPTDDPLFGRGEVRADGRKIHDMHLFQVKAPDESRGAWDYYRKLRSIPAAQAFRPMSEGGCAMVRT
ncbi:ABC transporter substrate-binding protein [Roseomonas eburnea]|uniref:ABC transporter substrate-binding protein n=1 Tax=Neoroseomonas eburnea TaxID=1346889 RepID=A0A9X9XC17_9PROT|nr:ABC transporter substrate-binding protein [Neoroseomonas eburnea]MBR0681253.1 ABC transporter substrate-binding protein [Neoroseomonas eburnea]